MQIGRSFNYMFEDPTWLSKYLVGALISAIPILNVAWAGYGIGIMRNVARGEALPLPTWDDLGEFFRDGLIIFVVSLIYLIPVGLLVTLPAGLFLLPSLSANQDLRDLLTGAASLGYLAMCGVGIIYLLAYTFFFPALEIHYARVSNFAECFRVGKIMRVATRNPGNYISAWLVGILLSFLIALFSAVLSVVIGWIPCLGQIIWLVVLIFSSIWGWTVISHIYGQVGLADALAEQ